MVKLAKLKKTYLSLLFKHNLKSCAIFLCSHLLLLCPAWNLSHCAIDVSRVLPRQKIPGCNWLINRHKVYGIANMDRCMLNFIARGWIYFEFFVYNGIVLIQ